jgi:hypothetical protein
MNSRENKKIIRCANCRKQLRHNQIVTLFSGSISGVSCVTRLCRKCAGNNSIMEKMQHINDRKLEVMDGERPLSH